MKTTTKLMLAIGAVLGSGVAGAQVVNDVTPSGSDIILFVTDLSTSTAFVQDLGVSINSLGVTTASVQSDPAYSIFGTGTAGPLNGGGTGPITVGAGLITGGIDTALAAFTSGHTGDNLVYGFLAAGDGDGSTGVGQSRVLFSYNAATTANILGDEPSTGNVNGAVSAIATFFIDSNLHTASNFGSATGLGAQAAGSEGVVAEVNSNKTGVTTYLTELAGYGDQTDANVYQSLTGITVNANGSITGLVSATVSAVPLPAAVWLLGSGVVGLLGIGRRRVAAKVS